MTTLSLRLPASLHERLREVAAREGVSINTLLTLAAAEKVASILTVDYLAERARAADLGALDRLLSRVPDAPALPGDEWTPRRAGRRPPVAAGEVHESASRYRARTPKRTGATKPKPRKGR